MQGRRKKLLGYNAINNQIIQIRLSEKFFHMLSVYGPAINTEEEVDELYGQVQFEIATTCKQDVQLVIGNWNCKIGNNTEENTIGFYD